MTKGNYTFLRSECYCSKCKTKFKAGGESAEYRCACGNVTKTINYIEKVTMKDNIEFATEKLNG